MKTFRIVCYFKSDRKSIVPKNYRKDLTGFLHKNIIGDNNKYHDDVSLYSISPLWNSKTVENGLIFPNGAIWIISTPNTEIFKEFYFNAKKSIGIYFNFGLTLDNVEFKIKEIPENLNELSIDTSPVFLGQNKNNDVNDDITYLHGDEITSDLMKKTFLMKAKKMGYNFNENDVDISFDSNFIQKTLPIIYHNHLMVTTKSKIKIKGNSDVIGLCYGFGIGKSTGCGFGFLYNF